MVGRLRTVLVFAFAAAVLVPATQASAQDGGRFRVLIPYFTPLEGAKANFGRDASKDLRALLSEMPTHVAMEEGAIKEAVKQFKMKIDDLDCIRTRQLASQQSVPVAICASYTAQPDKSWMVTAEVWDIAGSESFPIESFQVGEKGRKEAAQQIYDAFERYSTTVRSAAICGDYYASQQWENALRNCDESLALNPSAIGTRYLRARILYELENFTESLTELERVIGANPFHEDALQLAGYIATTQGDPEAGRDYYRRYLDINPGNVAIRMRIAYEMAQAGDPVGAMEFIQVGLDVDPESVDLLEQYGGFAFSAALAIQQEASVGNQDAGAVAPEAVAYYRQAINAYEKVFQAKGADTPVGHLSNVVSARIQLDEIDEAIAMSERVLETHATEDRLWVLYADALQRGGRLDDAIVALDRVMEINPEHPSAPLRQGNWLIQAGRLDDAVTVLAKASTSDAQRAEQAARMIFAEAYQNGNQKDNYTYAAQGMAAAKRLPNLSPAMTSQLNFWHGYSIYQLAVKEQEPQTLQTAQSSLPKFNQAVQFLNQSGDYPASVNVNLQQLLENAQTYIEIQDAIIKRGR
jgi:tetratricopeptide (TPR) repeat protein